MTNIGIFDSGLGGLTVLRRLVKDHKANYFYLGDNKNVPYGNKEGDDIKKLSQNIVSFLEKKDIDFYIIACNTISVIAKDYLKEKFNKDFISITDEAIKEALKKKGDVFVMATKATCESHYYKENIEKKSNKKVYEKPCIKLVDLIENAYIEGKELDKALSEYLEFANKKRIENIILACTHYPIIESEIEKNLTYPAHIIDPARVLNENISFDENENTNIEIYMTDKNKKTDSMVKKIMGKDIEVKKAAM